LVSYSPSIAPYPHTSPLPLTFPPSPPLHISRPLHSPLFDPSLLLIFISHYFPIVTHITHSPRPHSSFPYPLQPSPPSCANIFPPIPHPTPPPPPFPPFLHLSSEPPPCLLPFCLLLSSCFGASTTVGREANYVSATHQVARSRRPAQLSWVGQQAFGNRALSAPAAGVAGGMNVPGNSRPGEACENSWFHCIGQVHPAAPLQSAPVGIDARHIIRRPVHAGWRYSAADDVVPGFGGMNENRNKVG